jgi:hypothetical protein
MSLNARKAYENMWVIVCINVPRINVCAAVCMQLCVCAVVCVVCVCVCVYVCVPSLCVQKVFVHLLMVVCVCSVGEIVTACMQTGAYV